MVEKIDDIKAKHPGEWLAIKIEKETDEGEDFGELVTHNTDRRDLHKELREKNIKGVYVTFAGPIVKPGYEVLL
ncbi:MAG: hypothetical protein AB1546_07145 [bacterium]